MSIINWTITVIVNTISASLGFFSFSDSISVELTFFTRDELLELFFKGQSWNSDTFISSS